jgi:hypothetical protein
MVKTLQAWIRKKTLPRDEPLYSIPSCALDFVAHAMEYPVCKNIAIAYARTKHPQQAKLVVSIPHCHDAHISREADLPSTHFNIKFHHISREADLPRPALE